MQKVFQLITTTSLWVLAIIVVSIVLFWLLYFGLTITGRSSAFVYLPLFLVMVSRILAMLCAVLMGLKLGTLCITGIIRKSGGIEVALPKVDLSQVRNDVLIFGALLLLLVLTNK